MPPSAAPDPQADADRLEAAADQAIAACGGNARDAEKALLVANEYLESEINELMQAVSHAYVRGRLPKCDPSCSVSLEKISACLLLCGGIALDARTVQADCSIRRNRETKNVTLPNMGDDDFRF
jgi:hypothetical protein